MAGQPPIVVAAGYVERDEEYRAEPETGVFRIFVGLALIPFVLTGARGVQVVVSDQQPAEKLAAPMAATAVKAAASMCRPTVT